jgi:lysophospholipase L1-like esterase
MRESQTVRPTETQPRKNDDRELPRFQRHPLRASLVLAAVSICATLLALELGLRAAAFLGAERAHRDLENVRRGASIAGGEARLGQIIRLSANPRLVYELIPELDVSFLQAPLRTNAQGWRGPSRSPSKPERTLRLVGLGDSVMFGWGVAYEDCYLAQLEQRLNRDAPGVSWQALDTAVPGYNTVMEIETLKTKGLQYQPDLVLLNFVGNDLGLPNFIEQDPDYLAPTRSFLLDFVRARLGGRAPESGPRLVQLPHAARRVRFDEDEPRHVPAKYRDMVGLGAFQRAMKELQQLSREHNFEVAVLAHPQARDFVKTETHRLGFLLIETQPQLEAFLREHGQAAAGALAIDSRDPHPSPLGHELIAQVLEERLRASGVVDRLVARSLAQASPSQRPR